MSRLRILVLAPDASPESICGPLIGYCQAQALAQHHRWPWLFVPSVRKFCGAGRGLFTRSRWSGYHGLSAFTLGACVTFSNTTITATTYRLLPIRFVLLLNGKLGGNCEGGSRLASSTSCCDSCQYRRHAQPVCFFSAERPCTFRDRAINGGLPWPPGFSQAKNQKQWISGLRNLYRFMPFARSTYRHAAAIVAGSSQTYAEFAAYREKLFFLPENGVDRVLCSASERRSGRG